MTVSSMVVHEAAAFVLFHFVFFLQVAQQKVLCKLVFLWVLIILLLGQQLIVSAQDVSDYEFTFLLPDLSSSSGKS